MKIVVNYRKVCPFHLLVAQRPLSGVLITGIHLFGSIFVTYETTSNAQGERFLECITNHPHTRCKLKFNCIQDGMHNYTEV